jgi:hypothetical protein
MENMRLERNRTEKIFKKFEMINSLDREWNINSESKSTPELIMLKKMKEDQTYYKIKKNVISR